MFDKCCNGFGFGGFLSLFGVHEHAIDAFILINQQHPRWTIRNRVWNLTRNCLNYQLCTCYASTDSTHCVKCMRNTHSSWNSSLSLSFSYCQHRNNSAILLKISIEMFIVTMMCSLDVYYVRCIAPTSPLLQCSECLSIFSCLPPSQPFNIHEKFAIEWRGKTSSCAF